MMAPFAAVDYLLYPLVLVVDDLVLQKFRAGELTMEMALVSLQWLVIGVVVAVFGRWITLLTKESI